MNKVEEFNKAFNLPINVIVPQPKDIELRQNLVIEELEELWEAVQLMVHAKEEATEEAQQKKYKKGRVELFDALIDLKYVLDGIYVYLGLEVAKEPNFIGHNDFDDDEIRVSYDSIEMLIKQIDHTLDNQKVLDEINMEIAFITAQNGFKRFFESGFYEVHASNMSKLENGKPIYREDGKVLKGKDYFKPNLKDILYHECDCITEAQKKVCRKC